MDNVMAKRLLRNVKFQYPLSMLIHYIIAYLLRTQLFIKRITIVNLCQQIKKKL